MAEGWNNCLAYARPWVQSPAQQTSKQTTKRSQLLLLDSGKGEVRQKGGAWWTRVWSRVPQRARAPCLASISSLGNP